MPFRPIALCSLLSILLFSCSPSPQQSAQSAEKPATESVTLVRNARLIGPSKPQAQLDIEAAESRIRESGNPLVGYWVGAFGKNKITLALASAEDGKAAGYSICAGNYRPIQGSIEQQADGRFRFVLEEPGDDPYDGRFEFRISLADSSLTGSWTPFKAQGNSPKTYALRKRAYRYDPSAGSYPQASQRLLTEEDVSNLHPDELSLARNEIYARHGYSFKNKDFRYHFEAQDWYMPLGVDIRERLSETEVRNIDLIYRYEKYYEEYYDDFGR
jgi:hypothetical protein